MGRANDGRLLMVFDSWGSGDETFEKITKKEISTLIIPLTWLVVDFDDEYTFV